MNQNGDAIKKFVDMGYEMRLAQRGYFRVRDSYNLRVAKELEKRVHNELKVIRYPEKPGQSDLFSFLATHPDTKLVEEQCKTN